MNNIKEILEAILVDLNDGQFSKVMRYIEAAVAACRAVDQVFHNKICLSIFKEVSNDAE